MVKYLYKNNLNKTFLPGIGVFAYNRPKHLKKTLDALEKNYYSSDLDLFLFCDGPKNKKDNIKIKEICKIFKSLKNFKSKKIYKNKKNLGIFHSMNNGISKILEKKKSVIVLEDDVITNKFFLKYMINGLKYYKNLNLAGSISGYSYTNLDKNSYFKETLLSQRHASWGWGTWRHVWKKMIWDKKKISKIINDNEDFKKKFNKSGPDMFHMLKYQIEDKLDELQILFNFNCFLLNKYCICPIKSLTYTIGDDGSGIHCQKGDKIFSNYLKNYDVLQFDNLEVENKIIKKIYSEHHVNLFVRIKNFTKNKFSIVSSWIVFHIKNVRNKQNA